MVSRYVVARGTDRVPITPHNTTCRHILWLYVEQRPRYQRWKHPCDAVNPAKTSFGSFRSICLLWRHLEVFKIEFSFLLHSRNVL